MKKQYTNLYLKQSSNIHINIFHRFQKKSSPNNVLSIVKQSLKLALEEYSQVSYPTRVHGSFHNP